MPRAKTTNVGSAGLELQLQEQRERRHIRWRSTMWCTFQSCNSQLNFHKSKLNLHIGSWWFT